MKNTLKTIIAAAFSAIFMSSTAHAGIFDTEPAKGGFYLSGFVGIAFQSDADFEGVQNPGPGVPGMAGAPARAQADFDSDVAYGGAIGARLPFKYLKYFQPRLELEISTLESDVSDGNFNGNDQIFSGDQSFTFYLINNNSDIIWDENQRIVPSIGGGIGVADVDTNILYFPNNGVFTAPTFGVIGSETALVTTGTLGLTYKATQQVDVYTEARYYKVYNVDSERRFIANGNNGFSADVDDNLDGITISIGARFNF